MLNLSLRFSTVALAAFVLSVSHLLTEPAEAQKRVPDYGNMVLTSESPVTGAVDALAFTPDSSKVIASEKDHFLVWNANTGERVRTIQGPNAIRSNFILFTSDGKTMITAGSDSSIRLLNFETGEVTQTLEGHKAIIVGLVLSPSGKLLASSSNDRTIRIWDVQTGKQMHELSGAVYPATALLFSKDEKKLTTFGGAGGIRNQQVIRTESWQWDIESGQPEDKDVIADFGPPYALTADGTALVGYGEVKTQISSTEFRRKFGLRRYSVVNKEFGNDFLEASYYGYGYGFSCIRIAPNKAALAIASDISNANGGKPGIYFWNGITPGRDLPTIQNSASAVITFSPDSRKIASWRDELKVKIFTAP